MRWTSSVTTPLCPARVHAVLAGARDDRLAAVAASIGYFDQSHMTAEFRRLMGIPPRAFFAGQLPVRSTMWSGC